MPKPVFLSGNSNKNLAKKVAHQFGCQLGKAKVGKFADGEISVVIKENLTNKNVVLMQSLYKDPNQNLVELLIMIDAIKRLRTRLLITVIPYFAYGRADRVAIKGEPVSAELTANLMGKAGIENLITIDLHSENVVRFLKNNMKLVHLSALPLFVDAIKSKNIKNSLVLAVDKGAIPRSTYAAGQLGASLIKLSKKRLPSGKVKISKFKKDIKGKNIIIFEDIVDTARTITKAAKILKRQKVGSIYVYAAHALLSGNALEKIKNSPIDKLFVTNTVPLNKKAKSFNKLKIIPIQLLIADQLKKYLKQF
jgi:ribose-phosphate pyrophosphokinase